MILKKGDYVNLSGCILQEKKAIYGWLIGEGNKFSELINGGVEYIECSRGVGVLRQVDLCESLSECCINNRTEELLTLMKQEKEMQELPEEFIIVNADKMAVREWLDGLGYKWCDGDNITEWGMDKDTLCYMKKNEGFTQGSLGFLKSYYPHLPIITPRIGVTGFNIETPNPNQDEIERMKKNIEELQASIAKLEGK